MAENGATPLDPWLNLGPGDIAITEDSGGGDDVAIDMRDDGSIHVDIGDAVSNSIRASKAHDANLAEFIDNSELRLICDDLLNGIDADLQSRQDWIDRRAAGIKHLALKVENPRSPSADADTAVEGQSVVRSPVMLDAVLRFQANARGELLPAGGPTKIRNFRTPRTIERRLEEQMSGAPYVDQSDILADDLELKFNYYLTVTDKVYYPDTNRMFFMQGFGGSGFKKVYACPIKRRPVSRAIDADDIIVSDNEISLEDCGRVTHRIKMRPSILRRMQLAGQYLDIDLQTPSAPDPDAVERAERDVAGLSVGYGQRPADYEHTIYECYCELDIRGFEHKEHGDITGLPLPYRVTIDKDSQEILEVRRNWKEDDDRYLARMPIVKYPFVEGIGFYGIGLLNIMGNATAAVTTSWRLALDSGAFSSWPGFLYSEQVGRQDTMTFRVGLGSGVKINTGGQPIGQNVMPLPYKDVTAGLVQVTQHIEEEARRVGGTPELMTGEGRQDVPVGTTLAMLDQAVKVIDSVHKGMHIAQAEELSLLRDLFIEDPDALVCNNAPGHQWEKADIVAALQNCDLSPQSDPNTPSHTIRVMKAVGLVQLVQMAPQIWDLPKVARRVANMVGMGDVDDLLAPPQPGAQPDLKHMEAMAKLQQQAAALAQKEQDSQRKAAMGHLAEQIGLVKERMNADNAAAERMSRERVEQMKVQASLAGKASDSREAHLDRTADLIGRHLDNQAALTQVQAKDGGRIL